MMYPDVYFVCGSASKILIFLGGISGVGRFKAFLLAPFVSESCIFQTDLEMMSW